MSFSLVHLSDTHFGEVADLQKALAVQSLLPDLEPDLTVFTGDLTLRARHGEFQAAKMFVRELERTAPVLVIPGDHDVQWWWRPLVPFAPQPKYAKFRTHFGPVLTPTLDLTEVLVASALTPHGVAWGSLTPQARDLSVKGHLPRREARRVTAAFARARPEQAKILVMHHNVLRGERSQRMGLARWRGAQSDIVQSGADLVLCGHDPQQRADTLDGVVISCAGSLSAGSNSDPSAFHRILIEDDAIQVEIYLWEPEHRLFKRTDMLVFARRPAGHDAQVAAGAV